MTVEKMRQLQNAADVCIKHGEFEILRQILIINFSETEKYNVQYVQNA